MLIQDNFGDSAFDLLEYILLTSWNENSTFGEEIMITFC